MMDPIPPLIDATSEDLLSGLAQNRFTSVDLVKVRSRILPLAVLSLD